jgi:hypothetical protein
MRFVTIAVTPVTLYLKRLVITALSNEAEFYPVPRLSFGDGRVYSPRQLLFPMFLTV